MKIKPIEKTELDSKCKDGVQVFEWLNGTKEWWMSGKRHRLDGPAIEKENGNKEWWVAGVRHRLGGPAVELSCGYKEWFVNGFLSRIDGPAIEYENGEKEWWYYGNHYHSEEAWFEALTKEEKLDYLFNMKGVK